MEPSKPVALPLKAGAETTVAGGGEPPYDGSMEHRITVLEAGWDAIFPTLATKADLAALGADLRIEFREGLSQNAMAISALRSEMQQSFGEVRGEVQQSLGEVRGEMHQSFGEVRIEIQQVRTDMQKLSADIKTWTLATVLTIIGTMLAAIIGISQIQKATPPAPIIITIPAAK